MPIFILLGSPIIFLLSKSWLILWLILELSSISFIIIIIRRVFKNDWRLVYFLIQTLGSIFFLVSFIISEFLCFLEKIFQSFFLLLIFSILIKLGIFPFHYWVIKLGIIINYKQMVLILIIQKIIPLWLLMINSVNILFLISLFGLVFATIIQFRTIRTILLIIFSSITHMRWIMILRYKYLISLFIYYTIYRFILFFLLLCFYYHNINFFFSKFSEIIFIYILISIYSLAGLPLLLGFLPKWIIFYYIIKERLYYFVFIFIIFTGINFYLYNRLIYKFLINSEISFYSKKLLKFKNYSFLNLFFCFNLIIL